LQHDPFESHSIGCDVDNTKRGHNPEATPLMTEPNLGIQLHLSERPDGLCMLVIDVHGSLLDQAVASMDENT
jgi:hypothetical protein